MIREAIHKLLDHQDLSAAEANRAMGEIMSGVATPVLVSAYLTALRMKGETAEEIFGSASMMKEKAVSINHSQSVLFDNCGTGGDGANTFNISTTSAFVIAAAGLPVGKHGNRSVSSQCGSADLLEALGIKLDLTPERVGEAIDKIGFGFMFAPKMHPAMKAVVPIRKELAARTIFNILGPLTNPASATHQLIGVFDKSYLTKLAEAASRLGLKRVGVVHAEAGIDEITTVGDNHLALADKNGVSQIIIKPEEYDFKRCSLADLAGGDAAHNAKITRSILSGEGASSSPARDTIILNSAVALFVGEKTTDIAEGIKLATETITSGKAINLLDNYLAFSNQ